MNGRNDKKIRVGHFEYSINENKMPDIAALAKQVQAALADKTIVEVPVLDDRRNQVRLLINGSLVEALVLDLDEGPPKPGELSP